MLTKILEYDKQWQNNFLCAYTQKNLKNMIYKGPTIRGYYQIVKSRQASHHQM